MSPVTFAAIGIDHRHIYGQAQNLIDAGARFKGWWTEGEPQTQPGFVKRFADVPRSKDRRALLEDPAIDLVTIAAIPSERAALAIEAMRHGKDVMVDKPGCTSLAQLQKIRQCVAETGRIWSIDFSERFEVPAVTKAAELVHQGAIGKVVQTLGLGPHRLNLQTRPDWFFEPQKYGGILCDIASHQIDQLSFTGAEDAEIVMARAENFAHPEFPGLQDFGELSLKTADASGYLRVDWYTADALPNWGDGRLFLLGTEGTLELRKYCEVGRSGQTDNIYLTNHKRCEFIDARDAGLPYFGLFLQDIGDRTETAMPQQHAFTVMDLALRAQQMADHQNNQPG